MAFGKKFYFTVLVMKHTALSYIYLKNVYCTGIRDMTLE